MNKILITLTLLLLIGGCHDKNINNDFQNKKANNIPSNSIFRVPIVYGYSLFISNDCSDCGVYYPNEDSISGMIYLKKNNRVISRFSSGYSLIDDSNSISLIRNLKIIEWDTSKNNFSRFIGMSSWKGDTNVLFYLYDLDRIIYVGGKPVRAYGIFMSSQNPKAINKIISMYKSVRIKR